MTTPRYRVVQWATGNTGLRALREVIRPPSLDLVGVLVYDPGKDGADAGELCGEGPAGIAATTDRAANLGLGADAAPPGILTTEDLPHILPRGPRPAAAKRQ
jgi:2,4-diaminopentanoate dehydrogenase